MLQDTQIFDIQALLPNASDIKMISIKALVAATAFASLACAETHTITAREDNTFDPDTLRAAQGDVVEFHFERGNHSVVAGNYDFPCSPMQLGDGFFSGFMDTDDDTAVSQERSLPHARPLLTATERGLPREDQQH